MRVDQARLKEATRRLVPFAGKREAEDAIDAFFLEGKLRLRRDFEIEARPEDLWTIDQARGIGRLSHGWFFLRAFYTSPGDMTNGQGREIADFFSHLLEAWRSLAHDQYEMAYHDETTAMRVINLTSFVDAAEHLLTPRQSRDIDSFLSDELELLADPEFYGGINNHGMFQDFALIVGVAHGVVDDESKRHQYLELAFSRLRRYLRQCFTVEGIHTENSPSYHLMVSRYLGAAIELAAASGFSEEFKGLEAVLEGADLYASFCLSPTGSFVPISDTAPDRITLHSAQSAYGDGYLAHVVSDGDVGHQPAQRVFQASTSGYFVAHSAEERRAAQNYLFFNAAYNADYHKHSDELSIYYVLDRHELLREAGPNGYEYSDPYTKFAYSSRAHNTLLVDGAGLPRIDSNAHKTRMLDNDLDSESELFSVIGETRRFSGVKWQREVRSVDATRLENLSIEDRVESTKPHEYTFIWHFGREIHAENLGGRIILRGRDRTILATLSWNAPIEPSIRMLRGSEEKPVQGWQFPRMGEKQQSWAAEFSFRAVRNLVVTWEVEKSHNNLSTTDSRLPASSFANPARRQSTTSDFLFVGASRDDDLYTSDLNFALKSSEGFVSSLLVEDQIGSALEEWGGTVFCYAGVAPSLVVDLISRGVESAYVLIENEQDYIGLDNQIRQLPQEVDLAPVIVLAPDSFGDLVNNENFGRDNSAVLLLKDAELDRAYRRLVRSAVRWLKQDPESPLPHTVFENSGGLPGFGLFVPGHLYATATAELYQNGTATGFIKKLKGGVEFWENLSAGEYRARVRWSNAPQTATESRGAFGTWKLSLT